MQICWAIEKMVPNANSSNYTVAILGDGSWSITHWDLTDTQPTIDDVTNYWNTNMMDYLRSQKIDELDAACSQSILGKFTALVNGITYSFSNDTEAQSNFKDAKDAWRNGYMPTTQTVKWTAYDSNGNVVRLDLNESQLDPVNIARMQWQQSNVSKLRDTLEPQVNTAQTEADLDAITW